MIRAMEWEEFLTNKANELIEQDLSFHMSQTKVNDDEKRDSKLTESPSKRLFPRLPLESDMMDVNDIWDGG